MNSRIHPILNNISHRKDVDSLPNNWVWSQEWKKPLFIHYKVDLLLLRKLVPDELEIDTFNGDAYVSIVAFSMKNVRHKLLFSVSAISDFHEVNVRTYVKHGGHSGVYFLSIEAGKRLSAFLSRKISGLPYEYASINRSFGNRNHYELTNSRTGSYINTTYKVGEAITAKTNFDIWLTERYYTFDKQGDSILSYAIHHEEWNLFKLNFEQLKLNYQFGDLEFTEKNIDCAHYSDGVEVLAWAKTKYRI